ncbi:pilin [Comamonas faecalis]
MSETATLKTAVETCMMDGVELEDCESSWTASNLIGDVMGEDGKLQEGLTVAYNLTDATATITATFGENAAAPLRAENKDTLAWVRNANGSWACSTSIDAKFRPAGCKEDLTEPDTNPDAPVEP